MNQVSLVHEKQTNMLGVDGLTSEHACAIARLPAADISPRRARFHCGHIGWKYGASALRAALINLDI